MATVPKTGVYWPYKTLLEGSGITFVEDTDTIRIVATGSGTGGTGDMLKTEYAPSGISGVVDHAKVADTATNVTHATNADRVPWTGITGIPTNFPTDWSYIANKPAVFPTSWDLIVGAPTVFPPVQHGPAHLSTGTDPIPLSAVGIGGLLGPLSGQPTDYLNGTGVFANFATNVAVTALQRSGDSLAANARLIGTADLIGNAAAYSEAPFLSTSISNGGFAGIGFQCKGYWACALGAYQLGLYIATSAGQFTQLTDQAGHIVGAALAAGAAVANLGYTPLNKAGDTSGGIFVFNRDVGLGAASYTGAPIRLQNVTSGGRPQIGFLVQGIVGASLYLETDSTFRYINSAGTVARLHDTLHPLQGAELAAGAAIANLGYYPINKAGDTLVGQHIWSQDLGIAGTSYSSALLRVQTATANTAARAGIGFLNQGRAGFYLYFDNDAQLKFVTSWGAVKTVQTV